MVVRFCSQIKMWYELYLEGKFRFVLLFSDLTKDNGILHVRLTYCAGWNSKLMRKPDQHKASFGVVLDSVTINEYPFRSISQTFQQKSKILFCLAASVQHPYERAVAGNKVPYYIK